MTALALAEDAVSGGRRHEFWHSGRYGHAMDTKIIVQLPNHHSPERVYEIPLEIVLKDSRKANAVLRRLGKNVDMKSSGSSLVTLVGPDLKVCYRTERRVRIELEDMQCDDGTTEQVFVNKVPGVDDLGTCSFVRDDQSLEAAEVLEKCLLWNYNEARETWSSLG